MSVILKGMEMPKICDYCPMCKFYPEKVEVWCNAANRLCHKGHRSKIIPDWCPLVEIPEGARLIDAKELKKKVLKWMPPDPCGVEEKEYPFETDICVSMLMEIDEASIVFEEDELWRNI